MIHGSANGREAGRDRSRAGRLRPCASVVLGELARRIRRYRERTARCRSGRRARAGQHFVEHAAQRRSVEVPAHVRGEASRGVVTLARRLAERLQHDPIQIVAQAPVETPQAHRCRVRVGARRRIIVGLGRSQARRQRTLVTDRSGERLLALPLEPVRHPPREQQIQQHAELVHVGGGRDGLASRPARGLRTPASAAAPPAASPAPSAASFLDRAPWRCRNRAASPGPCPRRECSRASGHGARCFDRARTAPPRRP